MHQPADTLEDDFVPDDLVALSEDGEAEDGFLSEQNEATPDEDIQPSPDDQAANQKKRKRREKANSQKRKLVEAAEAIEESIATQSPETQSKYIASMQVKTFVDLSALELDDMRIPETSIADTTSWNGSRSLDNLVPFIMKAIPQLQTRLSQRSKTNGAPTLLFVASSALRVVDLTRVLKDKRLRGEKGGEVAKLFAKHFKVPDHIAYLQRTKVGAAVGTPGRIGKLLSAGKLAFIQEMRVLIDPDALAVSALSHIILDITSRDAKRRNLLDIPETRDEVFKTVLGAPAVLQAIKAGKVQVVLF
ncbi:U3-containing 90S pre-ribosomal complex subunit-domain containing protein [Mycena floridula]|nr:U3-containing 90S pre-ribosomal complex subunit-domain containing protein [Mycena floridula]